VLLLAGGLFMMAGARRRRRLPVSPLSADEKAELDTILERRQSSENNSDRPAATSG
jgi:cytochrome c-type biogenesis protein CcmH/NrfF